MAYQTLRTLAQLKREVRKLGLEVVLSGKRESKEDYVRVLRSYHLHKRYGKNIPRSLSLMLQIQSPGLCFRYNQLKDEEKEEIWNSDRWFLEEKMDGVRMLMFHVGGKFDFFSRNISVKDYCPVSYADTIYLDYVDPSKIVDEFILDTEVVSTNPHISTIMGKRGVVTETQLTAVTALLALNPDQSKALQKESLPLKFYCFDVLWWNGKWLLSLPLRKRRAYLKKALEQLKAAGMRVSLPAANISNKRQFYRAILHRGGEGVVAKNLDSHYEATTSRRRDVWVKIKRSMSETLQMQGKGDTVDAFVTGYEEADEEKGLAGLVGALQMSVYLKAADGSTRLHMIARVANIPLELRKQMTVVGADGKPRLRREWYGRVAEIDGQCVSARSMRLTHPRLIRWRPDRSPDTCVMDEGFIRSMIL